MSRLIVKGLPPYVSDARLREHFSQKGAVTDVKLMRRPDGTSRRFGFVGFRTEDEARSALEYFDRTYLDTARLSVSFAKKIGDDTLYKNRQSAEQAEKPKEKSKDKPKSKGASFDEFLAVMAPKLKRKKPEPVPVAPPQDTPPKKKARKPESEPEPEPEAEPAPSDGVAHNEELSDLEYMRQRMRHKVAGEAPPVFTQSDDEASENESESEEEDPAAEAHRAKLAEEQRKDEENVDTLMQSGRLFVRNLPYSATEDELEAFFSTYGPVTQVHIPLDPTTKASKGLAFVRFDDPNHALVAYRARDGAIFQGRLLHVIPAVELRPKPDTPATLKQQRAEARRATAGKDFNWNMLYMNSDAVASSVSDRLGISKSDILNPDEGNAAVRLALAETRVIAETKQFFEQHGVDLERVGKSRQRSDDTILVKNIPYGTTGDEVRSLFSAHGDVGRVLIPPSGTIAVVEMPVVGEARTAFRALAYKRFKDSVLYLEKAPASFLPAASGTEAQATISAQGAVAAPESSRTLLDTTGAAAAGATLFVKNLSFATTNEGLAAAFRALDGFAFARVQTKADPRNPGGRLSMGYGFVGFATEDDASAAQRAMDGHVLDGHTLAVAFSRRGHDADDSKPVKAPSTKMLVKNVPFEATKKDLRALFSAHGQLKSVRLPKQVHGRTRGFGFVEFVSRREAENAMAALKHTHLLGRHLVLEWSGDEGAAVDELRDKTRKSYVTASEREAATGKRSRIRLGAEDMAAAQEAARADKDDD
ncbi:Multiple RNA-binding domain-containing protein 1 [Malassezia cuniculi]|uniref:Multiple RNA-binding domain-containing protein 1 n=1 Tax=Malassezia cuniculi TaxID=948313 RepID=A0AAF0J6H1_9BASI|nr:Multiple RNA-binding domain-containing protein 1 [Malassezia cuniculi]